MVETSRYDKSRYKAIGLFAAIGLHGGLILFLLYFVITTPIPPYPEGGGGPGMGIEVNLGNSQTGTGDLQENLSLSDFKEIKSTPVETQQTENTNENLITSEDKEAQEINKTNEREKKHKKNKIKADNQISKNNKTNTTETTTDPNVEVKKTVNTKALYKKNTNQGEGNGEGDQGNPNGSPLSNQYKGTGTGGNGNGEGGGGGTGGGLGTGTGTGTGPGISFNLEGRIKQFLSMPEKVKNHSGIVVVEIKVDREGNVVDAISGVKGSTTLDAGLLKAAKEAADKTKFERKPEAPEFQKGFITYNFVLQ